MAFFIISVSVLVGVPETNNFINKKCFLRSGLRQALHHLLVGDPGIFFTLRIHFSVPGYANKGVRYFYCPLCIGGKGNGLRLKIYVTPMVPYTLGDCTSFSGFIKV